MPEETSKIHLGGCGCLPELSFRAQSQRSHQTSAPVSSLGLFLACGTRGLGDLRDGDVGAAQPGCEETWACIYQLQAQCY